jgi:hypothetical protein
MLSTSASYYESEANICRDEGGVRWRVVDGFVTGSSLSSFGHTSWSSFCTQHNLVLQS